MTKAEVTVLVTERDEVIAELRPARGRSASATRIKGFLDNLGASATRMKDLPGGLVRVGHADQGFPRQPRRVGHEGEGFARRPRPRRPRGSRVSSTTSARRPHGTRRPSTISPAPATSCAPAGRKRPCFAGRGGLGVQRRAAFWAPLPPCLTIFQSRRLPVPPRAGISDDRTPRKPCRRRTPPGPRIPHPASRIRKDRRRSFLSVNESLRAAGDPSAHRAAADALDRLSCLATGVARSAPPAKGRPHVQDSASSRAGHERAPELSPAPSPSGGARIAPNEPDAVPVERGKTTRPWVRGGRR
jgi:hypothetical protein